MEPTSAFFIALFFFYQAGFTSIIGKLNMYTDLVAALLTVGVCGFLWHCLAPLASQQRCTRVNKSGKKKQAETGF